ncbi:MAG: HIT family protein, partial [Cellulophaga baltica]
SKKVGQALESAIDCKRVGMTVIGLEVPHVHVHLIPLNEMKDATFQHKVKFSEEEFIAIAEKIKAELA